jgi:very-short-patch-repair endonuclease
MLQMAGSPASIIAHEHEKKRKLKPIRTLMKEIPSFIQELKPCFLMSPLSVSTYLPDDIQFDVTIFDEASQVFPEDAIVAIYRSRQLIVVGDSKQMPPTKFFLANDSDGDDFEEGQTDVDSFESILDLCSTTFPKKLLMCHYRSRTEDLISFSNKNFYGYNLVTYPSVYEKKEDLGVDFVYLPDGVMDSRSKINIKEAEKVVDLVFEHFKKHPKRSLGVVAFNIKQQDAILRLLEKRRSADPSMEDFFKPDIPEPFFVKNLETVQGDERDTIIFSVTYAKNDKGQFALRFGPLNLVGGERRLNVAITRAKFNVKVVSSIKAFDIDVSRVSNDGPKLLHDYLDYAEHGVQALERAISASDEPEFDSPFEQDVYEFLKENGFEVTTQVGCSKYRIDLGLKRPGTSDYVLAIECDGATYHSSNSARDRDRLRQSILERMNWRFYRIWSTDWYKNNLVEKKALIEECKRALARKDDFSTNIQQSNDQIDISNLVQAKPLESNKSLYDAYSPYKGQIFEDNVSYTVEKFVEAEGPMSLDYLLKKICGPCYGYEKVTQVVKEDFEYEFHSSTVKKVNGFLYGPNQTSYAMRQNIGAILGDINYVSDYELRNGMYAAIESNIQCKKEELFVYIRAQLGFSRAGEKMLAKFESAFKLLDSHIIVDENGYISIDKKNPLKIIRRG